MSTRHDLSRADACARAMLTRLDTGEHDLDAERAATLRPAVEELRWKLGELSGRGFTARITGTYVLLALPVLAGLLLRLEGPDEWRLRLALAIPVAGICAVPLVLFRSLWRRRLVRSRQPEPSGGPAALVDEITGTLQGLGILAGREFRLRIAHAEACAARAWSLVHGGPLLAVPESEAGPPRPRWSRREARVVDGIARRVHELAHVTGEEAAAADEPDDALHRLARYDAAHGRLRAAADELRGRRPWWEVASVPFAACSALAWTAASVSATSIYLGLLQGSLAVIALRVADPAVCRFRPDPNLRTAMVSLHAGVLFAVEKSLADLADLAGHPPAPGASVHLTAARDFLRPTGKP
ncbi:hypothetical protein AB0I28_29065 [Phytomonospora sp. NPDC050363]|uniref:hypothetical protein n=1 Tax=Phytomonospora sp. NPDC050363 TaxID=3155642 RepID=UPI0033FEE146